jgi:Serine/threonine protein kinase
MEPVLAIVALLAAGGTAFATAFESARRRARVKRSAAALSDLKIRSGADLPDFWSRFVHEQTYLDTRTRAVLRGRLGREADCVVKVLASRGSAPAESFGIFREAFVLNWLAGRDAPELLGFTSSKDGRAVALAMTAAPGQPLSAAVAGGEPPTMSDVHELIVQLCTSVKRLHEAGFVHGDIKPSNIIAEWDRRGDGRLSVRPSSSVILVDFESASLLVDHAAGANELSTVRGTHGFTAPERFWRFDSSPKVDVYSCGVVASFVLTLAPRRPGTSLRERITIPGWRRLIERATAAPNMRPDSIDEFLREWTRSFRDAASGERERVAVWPSAAASRLADLRASGALSSVMVPQSEIADQEAWRAADALRSLNARDREIFELWLNDTVGQISYGRVAPVLAKLERSYFAELVANHPNLTSMLALDTVTGLVGEEDQPLDDA